MKRLNLLKPRLSVTQAGRLSEVSTSGWHGSENSTRLYDRKWRRARADFLLKNPLCVDCLEENKTVPANEVDHVIPHRGDMELFWNEENWAPRCKPHHSAKTARENGGFGNVRR